jgi:hypothetical protein
MKKLFVLAFVVLFALIVINRQRVFLRDPLGSVYKSVNLDGSGAVKQSGVQVYINYSNDILLLRETQPGAYSLLVQHWSKIPGTPARLKCIHWMACMTDADHAAILPVQAEGKYDPKVQMTNREVSFLNRDGALVRVQLR